ncbi:MAG: guanylate kinase [Candidatus Tectimicrobiota bacterium]|nr:MAG: guanylate kinase [Candidatus Tectomicrobia bacterium]
MDKTPTRRGVLFVVSAPSGAGKTSLCQRLVAELDDVVQSVSYTTRPPRPGERHGREYYFVSREVFRQHVAAGDFLEWAEVHGEWYGTSRQQVEAATHAGKDVLLAIDVQGAAQLRAAGLDAVFVFVLPPSWEVLRARLQQRGSESPAAVARRLAVARQELAHYTEYDYVVVNDELAKAVAVLRAIVVAERHRVRRVGCALVSGLLQAATPATEDG